MVARTDSEILMSSPILGLLGSRENNKKTQVKVGQVFERIYLTASILSISLQPMSQIIEIPELKAELTKLIPLADVFPQQPFRLGYAKPEKEHTPRRPVEEVLI